MAPYVDLWDDKLFPSWHKLSLTTHTHYCFLAEIQECDGFLRYRTIVRDRGGAEVVVAFYPDSYDDGFDFKKLKRGHTLAIANALQHEFLDGTEGVRVEDMYDVCVRSNVACRQAGFQEADELTGSCPRCFPSVCRHCESLVATWSGTPWIARANSGSAMAARLQSRPIR